MKILILSCIVVFLASCASWQSPKIEKFSGIKKVKVESRQLFITVSGDVLNPNNKNIQLNESSIDLFIENKKIGTISNLEKITLKKNDISSLSIPLSIETEKGALIRLATFTLKDSVTVQFVGDLNVRAGVFKKTVPLNESKKISTRFLKIDKDDAIRKYR